jgi:endonuclease/exonuclease/phosphatase family metal-dependent hydrolase
MSQRQKKITSYMSNRRVSRLDFLKVLTWNLAGDDLHASFHFDLETKYEKIALEVEKHKPDILNLQETTIPHEIWEDLGYKLCGSTRSHGSGLVELWYRSESCQLDTHLSVKPDLGSTKYAFPIAQFSGKFGKVTVCNIHLYPGKDNAKKRLDKLGSISEAIGHHNPVIIMGDANMRDFETDDACRMLGMQDVYNGDINYLDVRFTWDGFKNEFHSESFRFRCRFDRIFIKNLVCYSLDFVGNEEINDAYLSDHFGLVAKLEFTDFPDNQNHMINTILPDKAAVDPLSDCLAKIDINHAEKVESESCCLDKIDANLVKTKKITVKSKKAVEPLSNCEDNNLVRTKEYTVKLKKR